MIEPLNIPALIAKTPNRLERFRFLVAYYLAQDTLTWRTRRTVQIEGLDEQSYRERITYQFILTSDFVLPYIQKFIASCKEDHELHNKITISDLHKSELDIYVPIDYLPKRTLMHFDLRDGDNSAIFLLNRFKSNPLQVSLMMPQLEAMGALNFAINSSSILTSIVFQAPHDLKELIRNEIRIKGLYNQETKICDKINGREKIINLLTKLLNRYFDNDDFLSNKNNKIDEICHLIDQLSNKIGIKNAFMDPCLNVFMLALDYFKTVKIHSLNISSINNVSILEKFFSDCETYLTEFINLTNSKDIYSLLSFYANHYYAFVPMKVKLDEYVMIKMEHLLPIRVNVPRVRAIYYRFKRCLTPLTMQLYTIKLGMEASQHYEVKCHDPSETEILHDKSFIEIGYKDRKKLDIPSIFGYSSSYTPHTQHFYTTKTKDEIDKICKKKGIQPYQKFRRTSQYLLGITYKINPSIIWTYRIGVLSLFLSALILFFDIPSDNAIYSTGVTSKKIRNIGDSGIHLFVPFITSIIMVSLRFRTKEKIVADYFKPHKLLMRILMWFIIICAGLKIWLPDECNSRKLFEYLKMLIQTIYEVFTF